MKLADIIRKIDLEIFRLQMQSFIYRMGELGTDPGRPPGNAKGTASARAPRAAKRKLSAAGRARISAAQKARWAKKTKE